MWEWLNSVLWKNRNEPLAVAITAALLIIGLFTLLYQVLYRQAPLYCDGMVLPRRASDCPKVTAPTLPTVIPIGTIVPYFGKDEDIPAGWVLCDGRDNPIESKIRIDSNSDKGGLQLPDLRNKFIRGSMNALNPSHVQEGGSDTISLKHAHTWARFTSRHWYSYINRSNSEVRVDAWNDGLGDDGSGDYPLLVHPSTRLYTEQVGSGEENNLPSFVELRFIIRIF